MIRDNTVRAAPEVERLRPLPAAQPAAIEFQFIKPEHLTELVQQEIVSFLDRQASAHPFQFPQWAGIDEGGFLPEVRFALLREGGELRWFARCGTLYPAGTFLPQIRALVVTHGPVCDDLKVWCLALQAFIQHAQAAGFTYIEISPELIVSRTTEVAQLLRRNGWESFLNQRTSLRLDLTRDTGRILANFRKSTRYEVHRADRVGMTVKISESDFEIAEFLKIYLAMAKRKRFSPDAVGHLRLVIRWFAVEPGRGALLLANYEGRIVGGVVLARAGKRCWYVWGATDKEDRFSVGHLLQWRAILWAKVQGCEEYDFGGFREGATSGPALFKRGFGGEPVHFLPTQRYPLRNVRYRLLRLFSGMKQSLMQRA